MSNETSKDDPKSGASKDHTILAQPAKLTITPSVAKITVTTSAESALDWIQSSASTVELQFAVGKISNELSRFSDYELMALSESKIDFAPSVPEDDRDKQLVRVLAKHKVDERRDQHHTHRWLVTLLLAALIGFGGWILTWLVFSRT